MTASRFSTRVVTFKHTVSLIGHEAPIPPGTHSLETEEVLIDGISRPVYQRTRPG